MRRLNITVIAGIIAAVLGVLIVVTYGHGVDKKIADGKATVGVLVSSAALTAGATPQSLTSKVEMKQVPRAYVSVDALGSLTALPAGSVLRAPVAKGTLLNRSAFTNPAAGGVGSGVLAPATGKVAVAIRLGLVPGVAHYLTAGSKVDLFVTYKALKADPNAAVTAPALTKLFASAVNVLAVTAGGTTSPAAVGDDVLLVLEATPALAQGIVNAQSAGELYAAMSNGETHSTTRGTTPSDVLSGAR